MWLAHRQPHALVAAIVTDVASRLANAAPTPTSLAGLLVVTGLNVVSLVAIVGVVAAFVVDRRHATSLCTRCARKIPTDGVAEATLHDRDLRVFHWYVDHPRQIIAVLLATTLPGWFLPPLWRAALSVVCWAFVAVAAAAALRHRPLQPWCRYCRRWDEGGDPEVAPTPDPQGTGTPVA